MPAASSLNSSRNAYPSQDDNARDARTTLPPISELLNAQNRNNDVRNSRPGDQRQRQQEPYSQRPQPLPSPPMDDKNRSSAPYDKYPLPMHSGPPSEQYSGYGDRPGASRSSYDHGSMNGSNPYGAAPRYDTHHRDTSSNLPPPPPSQYPPNPGYGGSATTHSPYASGYGRQPPPYPPNGYHPQPQYPPPHARHDHPSPYHESPPGAYGRDPMPMYDPGDDRPARRRRGNLPKWATDILKQWFYDHIAHPYPTENEKQELCKITGLGMTQLSNWFINARRRQNPVLNAQAQAETMLREGSNQSSGNASPVYRDSDGGRHPRH